MARSVEVVMTPTGEWLRERAAECRERFLVASPFVNQALVALSRSLSANVERTLVTRMVLGDFAVGASSLAAVCAMAKEGTSIKRLDSLHAKVYVFDDQVALVSSANATQSGFSRNWECGLAVHDPEVVRKVAESAVSGFGAHSRPEPATLDQLVGMRQTVANARQALPAYMRTHRLPGQEVPSADPIPVTDARVAARRLTQWQAIVLEAMLRLPTDTFTARDIYSAVRPIAAKRTRTNTPDDSTRKALQELAKKGYVAFLTPGRYRRRMVMAPGA